MGIEPSGTVENNGSITVGAYGSFDTYVGFQNNETGTLTVNENGSLTAINSDVENRGLFVVNSNAGFLANNVENAGAFATTGETVVRQIFNNTGTLTVNGIFEAQYLNNSGTVEVNNSSRTEDSDYGFFEPTEITNYIGDDPGMLVLNDSDVLANKIDNGAGTIILNNSTISGAGLNPEDTPGDGITLTDGHSIRVTGTSKIGGTVNAVSSLNIEGTENTSLLEFGDDIQFKFEDSSAVEINVANIQTNLDLSSSDFSGITLNVEVGSDTRVGGEGSSAANYVFNSNSWLRPGNSPGTFAANNITFEDGTSILLEIDFNNPSNFDQIIAEKGIDFNGTTTVYVTQDKDSPVNTETKASNLTFFTANNAGGSDTIKVGGTALDPSSMIDQDATNNTVTITNGDAIVIVKSAPGAGGDDAVTLGDYDASSTTFGFDEITATGVAPTDPSQPTSPDPGPGPDPGPDPNAPVQGSRNYATLRTVIIDDLMGKPLSNAVVRASGGGNEDALREIISQLDPVALSIGQVYTESAIVNFNHTLYDRIRLNTGNNYAGTTRGQSDPCEPIGCDPCDPCGFNGGRSSARQMWFQGVGGLINQEDADGIVGYDTNTYGFALGVDRKISRNTVVGFGFGNTIFDTDMNRGLGFANTKTYMFSVYGGHKIGSWKLSGSAGYVMSDLSSNRVANAIGGWANAERDAESYFGSFELARQFNTQLGYFTPFLAYDFVGYSEDGFRETGNLMGMTITERDEESYIQTLGARFGTTYVNHRGWIVNPGVTLGWIHDFGSGQVMTTGAFNEGGSPFTLVGTSRHKNRALVGFNIDAELSKALSIFGRYDGELANRYDSHTFQLGLAAQF